MRLNNFAKKVGRELQAGLAGSTPEAWPAIEAAVRRAEPQAESGKPRYGKRKWKFAAAAIAVAVCAACVPLFSDLIPVIQAEAVPGHHRLQAAAVFPEFREVAAGEPQRFHKALRRPSVRAAVGHAKREVDACGGEEDVLFAGRVELLQQIEAERVVGFDEIFAAFFR